MSGDSMRQNQVFVAEYRPRADGLREASTVTRLIDLDCFVEVFVSHLRQGGSPHNSRPQKSMHLRSTADLAIFTGGD
jgi:hypothetical protein